jgi:hypothetical protein
MLLWFVIPESFRVGVCQPPSEVPVRNPSLAIRNTRRRDTGAFLSRWIWSCCTVKAPSGFSTSGNEEVPHSSVVSLIHTVLQLYLGFSHSSLLSFQLSDDDAADTPLAQSLAERQNERVPRKNTTKTGSTAAGAMGKKGDRSEQVRHVDGKTVFIINVLRYQLRALADPEFRGTKLMVGSPRH